MNAAKPIIVFLPRKLIKGETIIIKLIAIRMYIWFKYTEAHVAIECQYNSYLAVSGKHLRVYTHANTHNSVSSI